MEEGLKVKSSRCSRIDVPPFRGYVYLDLQETPQLTGKDGKIYKSNTDDEAFICEVESPGCFYIWLGKAGITHSTIAHECLHLVDGITRAVCAIPNPTPTNGDLADETRAYLLTYLYEEIQKVMIKKHKYPKK